MKSIILLFAAVMFLGMTVFAQADIRKVDFKNFTYLAHCAGEDAEKVTVKNGEYSKETKQDGYTDHFYFEVRGIAYGDLTGDGKDEAVIITNCNTGGTGQFTEGFIYAVKVGKPALLARIPGGDRAYGGLREARIENGLLVVESNDEGEAGGACCPEFIVTSKYKVAGGNLAAVGSPSRRPVYPSQRVTFARGTSGSTITLNIRPNEGKRLIVGARSGQTLSVALNTDKVTAQLLEDADKTDVDNGFTAKLPKTGDYSIQLTNYSETDQTVIVTIKIK